MKTIKIKHPYNKDEIVNEDIVLILGYFDGVHLAHQKVIKEGVRIGREKNLKVALMTFNRHPSIVYRKLNAGQYANLTQPNQKAKLIESLGVDILYEVFFNSEFGNMPPQEFVDRYIVDWHAKVVVAGFDYTYGRADIASMAQLSDYAKGRFDIVQVGEAKEAGETISSTLIRQYIKNGEIDKANAMLGYSYETLGFVIHGDARGRELGYPTANIYSHPYTYLPGVGIYAVWFIVKGKRYMGMASIGYNVTFKNQSELSVEVNILDFNEEIYGDDVQIEWVAYLRGEVQFDGAEELIHQLQKDEEATRRILKAEED
ncbi:MAG TPA: riboflavin biosynthesis protein RibF [Candidatus Atopostipes pullistercoris]|uniref:Riboflavin biosynthesis protein n=1 Tax=Candidatus Atopostipes pullistercoris TaxID=2838467 RepID=A0A9D2G279_9LACT|nr:riboflavin biosynthesis protein RibF [Candidatus Atopostipes pullistercoris]